MKQYNGEKAIISLTSWKKRINTVGKTIFSLLQQCPGFHIVLVLSEEEFPKKEEELPEDLKVLIEGNKIEVLWVYKNYKSVKKVIFTLDKYREIPIISADDDCLYNCNYAEKLYNMWLKNPDCIITNQRQQIKNFCWTQGPNTLYPPYCFKEKGLNFIETAFLLNDDGYMGALARFLKINIVFCKEKTWYKFHDENFAISKTIRQTRSKHIKEMNEMYEKIKQFSNF